MDRFDPNQWTKTFVQQNHSFCMEQLRSTNAQVISMVKNGNYAPAIAGLDRILNGLVQMQNAGGDYSSEICFFSWVEADIILFGIEAPENRKRDTALLALQDARDFAKGDSTKQRLSQMISDLRSGKSLASLKQAHNSHFPSADIEMLTSMDAKFNSKPSNAPQQTDDVKPETVRCGKCGAAMSAGAKFCPNCGTRNVPDKPVEKPQPQINGIEQAIEQLKNGDERGFSYLYSRTYKYVYARAKCMFSNEESIKELMERVYLFVHQNIVNFSSSSNIYDWLRAIVFFQGTEIIKRQRKALLFTEEQGAVFSSLIEKETAFEKQQVEKEDIDIICSCFGSVTDDQRNSLVAYYYDKLKVNEIAELLSVNVGTINGRIYLGRQKLEEEVKEKAHRLGRTNPYFDKAVLEQAIGALLQQYMDISDAEGKAIFAVICKKLDQGGYQAINNEASKPAQKKSSGGNNSSLLVILIAIIVGVAAYFIFADGGKGSEEENKNSIFGQGGEDIVIDKEELQEDVVVREEETENQEEEEQEEEQEEEEQQEPEVQSEYILPDSSTRYLTDADVAHLSKEELALARNEIIARNGRIFTNEIYKEYFESKSWYQGTIAPEEFDANYAYNLSEIEKANIELIIKHEQMQSE